jgi:CRISPR-associated endonuclease Csn1
MGQQDIRAESHGAASRPVIAWRLGLDLGTNSLGWVALRLDAEGKPCGFLAAGSRIFSDGRDPKSKQSLAVDRRDARAMRRRRDRFRQRQRALIKYLVRDGLFPADPDERRRLALLDPYELRARALDEALTPGEIARAIFHLNQRRGFQSNRKADRGKKDQEAESGKVETGIKSLRTKIEQAEERAGAEAGSWTFGKWLHERRRSAPNPNEIPAVRTRVKIATESKDEGDDKNDVYDFYPGRALIAEEFDAIWHAQVPHHPALLTAETYGHLHEIVFHQRPLKEPAIGMCTLVPGERRLARAHPLFQRRRLLEEINALMVVRPGEVAERLTPEQRDLILLKFIGKRELSFESLRKQLKLDPAARFNKESEQRPKLKGDEVATEMGAKTRFDTRWPHLPPDEQWAIIARRQALESDADETAFRAWLVADYARSEDQAAAVARARLPDGFGRFGPTATAKLIEALTNGRTAEGRVLVYSEAVEAAGLHHHSDFRDGQVFADEKGNPALPYYGVALERHIMPGSANPDDPEEMRIGRLTNPTVHIGLNQLRRVVNALIRTYGPPKEIALELARELKLSEEEKKKRAVENNRNRAAAEGRSAKLHEIGQRDGGANRARLKLWEELNQGNVLDRRCPYSGVQIGIDMLFSDAVQIDHILPFDATLDDSNANKTVCLREANQLKRKRSPYEAADDFARRFGEGGCWDAISERAARLPRNKRWRFEPDAMEKFTGESGFLDRQLVDTQYLSRLAREYLVTLYPEKGEGSSNVWVSPGRLTELVRRKLGLNKIMGDDNIGGDVDQPKNRLDHRHHTIDAVVVAIVDRSMLNRIARASGQEGMDGANRIVVEEPWDGFRDQLRETLKRVTVAHRGDKGSIVRRGPDGRPPRGKDGKPLPDQTAGRLHNDTAYGYTGETDAKGNTIVVRRVPLASLKRPEDIAGVRDTLLREALREFTLGFEGKAFERVLATFPELGPLDYRGIRRVRKIEPLAVIPIKDASGRAYKAYKGDSNYRYDVWELPDGKWQAEVVSMFDAHQPGEHPRPHPAARKVLSLQQNDMIAIEVQPGERRLLRVVKFGQDGRLYLADAQESGALKARDADKSDPFSYVSLFPAKQKAWRARQVRIDELGRVLDPGFPARKAARRTGPRP